MIGLRLAILRSGCILFLLLCMVTGIWAQDTIYYAPTGENIQIGAQIQMLEDAGHSLTIDQAVRSTAFKNSTAKVPNMQVSKSAFWAKMIIKNTTTDDLTLDVAYPTLDSVTFVAVNADGTYKVQQSGEYVPCSQREYKHQNYIFDLHIPPGQSGTFYLKVTASEQFQLPLYLGTTKTIQKSLNNSDFIFGIYAGIIFVMFFYNLFVYFTVKDKTYLYYVMYILFVGLTQACVQGYSYRYLYSGKPVMANLMLVLAPSFLGLGALEFLKSFMNVKAFTPTLFKIIKVFITAYLVIIVLGCLGMFRLAANIVQVNAGVASICVLIVGINLLRTGFRISS